MNEELRSATEELETSQEELQSINEELITVNQELKSKVDELGQANSDLQNLMAATAIATVFVDRGLRIKRFTPRALELFNLIAADIGRPLRDITHRLDYPQLDDDARRCFETLRADRARGAAARTGAGSWRGCCRTARSEDRIDGVVLTFVDITAAPQAEEQLRAARSGCG